MTLWKQTIRTSVVGCTVAMTASGWAWSQDDWDRWEVEWGAEASLVVSAVGDPGGELPGAEPVLGEVSGDVRISRVLENGAEIGFRGVARAQRDHPARPGFAGAFEMAGSGAPGVASGLFTEGAALDRSARASLEAAYVYIDGGYGELTLGRDTGMAARFREAPPEVFRFSTADSALLDPSGIAVVATADRISGQSAKISYASPRWLGFRLGASLTPDADEHDGLDRSLDPFSSVDLGTAFEVALNGSRRIGRGGPRLSGGISWSQAERDVQSGFEEDAVQSVSASALYEADNWSMGLSWRSSDEGLIDSDYEALAFAAQRDFGDWSVSGSVGLADRNGLEGESARVGFGRELDGGIDIAFGWQWDEIQRSGRRNASSSGPVIEITLRL